MNRAIYSAATAAAVALVASTPKTLMAWQAGTEAGLVWVGYELGFTGVTSSDPPCLVELCYCTFATGGTGTAITERQESGRIVTGGPLIPGGALYGYSVEPTVLQVLREFTLSPNGGTVLVELDREFDSDVSQGFAIRLTPGSAITATARGSMRVARL